METYVVLLTVDPRPCPAAPTTPPTVPTRPPTRLPTPLEVSQ